MNISFWADTADCSPGKKKCFGRIINFSNLVQSDLDCDPDQPEIRGISGTYPRSFFDPTPVFDAESTQEQNYQKWIEFSWLPQQFDLKNAETARDDYHFAIVALNKKNVMPVFWTYTDEALILLLWVLDVKPIPEKWPGKVMKSNKDFIINGFKNPSMEELMSLTNRYSPKINRDENMDDFMDALTKNFNDFLNKTTVRTATMYVSAEKEVRVGLSSFPLPNLDFFVTGPWLQSICSKGLPPLDGDVDHVLDEFLLIDGQLRAEVRNIKMEQ